MEVKVFKCPLLKKNIDEGYCYDINMVRIGIAKENMLDDHIDKNEANKTCESCKLNQVKY